MHPVFSFFTGIYFINVIFRIFFNETIAYWIVSRQLIRYNAGSLSISLSEAVKSVAFKNKLFAEICLSVSFQHALKLSGKILREPLIWVETKVKAIHMLTEWDSLISLKPRMNSSSLNEWRWKMASKTLFWEWWGKKVRWKQNKVGTTSWFWALLEFLSKTMQGKKK